MSLLERASVSACAKPRQLWRGVRVAGRRGAYSCAKMLCAKQANSSPWRALGDKPRPIANDR